jgi:hypothetical protein
MKELVKVDNQIIAKPQITEKTIKDYITWISSKISDDQFRLFLNTAIACNLNPFKREIYCVPYDKNIKDESWNWSKVTDMSIVSWYQVYIDKATSTWLLDGWKVEQTANGAKITIYRKDFKYPFEWEVEMKEFCKTNKEWKPMWSWWTMPWFMIKKVAIGQGFRLAFPNEMGWLPYLQEEINENKETIPEISKEIESKKQDEYYEDFEKSLKSCKNLEELKSAFLIIWENKNLLNNNQINSLIALKDDMKTDLMTVWEKKIEETKTKQREVEKDPEYIEMFGDNTNQE